MYIGDDMSIIKDEGRFPIPFKGPMVSKNIYEIKTNENNMKSA